MQTCQVHGILLHENSKGTNGWKGEMLTPNQQRLQKKAALHVKQVSGTQ